MYYDDRPNGTQMAYYQATNFTLQDADEHYQSMDWSPIWISFNEINTSFITPQSFGQINWYIKSGEDWTYIIDDKKSIVMPQWKDYNIFGNLTLKVTWELTIKDGKWSFKWSYGALDDHYDFDVTANDWNSPERLPRNYATLAKGKVLWTGRAYDIQIQWKKELVWNGKVSILTQIKNVVKNLTTKPNNSSNNSKSKWK